MGVSITIKVMQYLEIGILYLSNTTVCAPALQINCRFNQINKTATVLLNQIQMRWM